MAFITTEDLLLKISVTPVQQEIFDELSQLEQVEIPAADFMALYRNNSAFWVFALLRALELACDKNSSDIAKSLAITDFYIRLEEWILEDPSFLIFLPDTKRPAIKQKAEIMLFKAYARREALELISRQEDVQYVTDILHKVELSHGNLYDRERKISVLFMVIYHHPELLAELTTELLRLFKLLAEQNTSLSETDSILNVIDKILQQAAETLDPVLLTGEITDDVRNKVLAVVRFTGAACLIAKRNNIEEDIMWRLVIYRYLCITDERHPEALKNAAFNTLATITPRPIEFTWEELIDFSLSRFADKISYFTAGSIPGDDSQNSFEGLGLITLCNKVFTITPWQGSNTTQLPTFISGMDGAINIRAKYKPKTNLNACPDLAVLSKHWEAALEEFHTKRKRPLYTIKKERPPVGTRLKIRVKSLTPSYPLLAFVTVEDDQYEGEGVLHVSEVTRIKLTTLVGVFSQGDLMTARVIESSDDRLSFSILEDLGTSIGARFHAGEYTRARLQAKKDKLQIWISESGYPVYSMASSQHNPEIGDVYVLKLKEVNYNGYIKAITEEQVEDLDIDPQQAVARLLSYYIDSSASSRYEQSGQTEEEDMEQEYEQIIPPEYIRQLIYILDLYTGSNMDYIHKYNLLYTIRLICRIAEEAVLEDFYIHRIGYMRELHRFADRKTSDYAIINDEIVRKYPRLHKAQDVLSILNISQDDSRIGDLHTYIESPQKQVAALARLLLSRSLLEGVCPRIADELNGEILSLLAFDLEESKETDEINFGRENNNREFKTTIVYPPDSGGTANTDEQMGNILVAICGFLNAEGGTIFIGVNDSGFPQGIEMDLHYLQANEDKYQLLIRRYIVKELGQTINSLIGIDFRTYNEKTVCLVTVPMYDQIVTFKGKVWQRQGNSTRLLDHTALKFLKERRKVTKITSQGGIPEVEASHVIPTSRLNPIDGERPTLAWFSILASGKYVITTDHPYRNDARITLPIYEDYRDGYLLQIYNNSCVNRVAVSTILSKKRDYEYINALFNNAAIVFVSLINKNDYIFIQTAWKDDEYIKLQSLKWIKINTDLSRQGTQLLAASFDRIVCIEILTPEQAKELENIKNEIPTSLGSLVTSMSVVKDVAYLKELLNLPEEEGKEG